MLSEFESITYKGESGSLGQSRVVAPYVNGNGTTPAVDEASVEELEQSQRITTLTPESENPSQPIIILL
jgi:hypothetical protein